MEAKGERRIFFRVRRGDDLKRGYELAELVVLSEPHTQLQGSAPLLQHEAAAARETLRSLVCLPSVLLTSC